MTAGLAMVEWGSSPAAGLASTFAWLVVNVVALWVHSSRWLTDGPPGRAVHDETSRMFLLEIPQAAAGYLGWVGVPVSTALVVGGALDLVGVTSDPAMLALSGAAAALLTVLTWRSGKAHRWLLPADPAQHTRSTGASGSAASGSQTGPQTG